MKQDGHFLCKSGFTTMLNLILIILLSGCGDFLGGQPGEQPLDGNPSVAVRSSVYVGPECPNGGITVETGIDENGNGVLDTAEIDETQIVCNGDDGIDGVAGADGADGTNVADGLTALTSITDEPAGPSCANSGKKIEVGLDDNGNGVLDPDEVDDIDYVCNGEDGQNGKDPVYDLTRISVSSDGVEGDASSSRASLSSDGRYIAFESDATNLVPNDTNGVRDIFVRDTVSGSIQRVSVATGGGQADGPSYKASISDDGRYVAFESTATNFVDGDINGTLDTFVYDRINGTTGLVSVGYFALAQGNSASGRPSISADGRYVAFESAADNVVPDDTNGAIDVFVRDMVDGVTTRVSVNSSEEEANGNSSKASISADGRYVAFESTATNLARVGPYGGGSDTNGVADIFVRDKVAGSTWYVSTYQALTCEGSSCWYDPALADSGSYNPSISANGEYVAFVSDATNLVPNDTNGVRDVFVRNNAKLGEPTCVSVNSGGWQEANGASDSWPSITAGGEYVAFQSDATNLVLVDTNGQKDLFVRNMYTGAIIRVSVDPDMMGSNGSSGSRPFISANGGYVGFSSTADNLVPNDTNGERDIFRAINPFYYHP